MTEPDLQAILRAGIAAAKAAQQAQTEQAHPVTQDDQSNTTIGPAPREQARTLLIEVLEADPTNIPAWLWLSTVVDGLANKQRCLEKVLEIDPNHKSAQAGLAHLARQAAEAPAQPAEATRLKRLSPRPGLTTPAKPAAPAAHHSNGMACPFCRQPISAMATACPHCQCSLVISCPACSERVDVEQATCPTCGQGLGDFRQGPAYFARLAAAYQEHQKLQETLAAWQAVERLKPDYPQLHLRMGEILAQVGRTETAIATLQQAMAHESDRLAAILALGKIYQQLHRWDEAQALYQQGLALDPAAPGITYALGWLLMEQGQASKALPYIRKATELNPRDGLAWLRLAQLYEHARNRRQATQAYQRAAALLPADTLANQGAQRRLETLQPALPAALATSSLELFRQMTGPVLICLLAALLDAGLRPWWIPWTGWLALILAVLGAFFYISADSLPQNPLICQLVGRSGLASPTLRLPVAILGALFWLLAFSLIMWPLGQSYPEVPR